MPAPTPGPLERMAATRIGDDRFLAGQLHARAVTIDVLMRALLIDDRERAAQLLLCRAVAADEPQRTRDLHRLAEVYHIDPAALRHLLI